MALFARSTEFIEELAADLLDPGEGLAVTTDLTDVEAIREGFETVRAAFGPVDVLVTHASAGRTARRTRSSTPTTRPRPTGT
jgi:NADP-dependent 3-hydroxy acid dehydrogenase YdfG